MITDTTSVSVQFMSCNYKFAMFYVIHPRVLVMWLVLANLHTAIQSQTICLYT